MNRTSAYSLCLAAVLFGGGCRMCQGPQDYCGPVVGDDAPTLGFRERHNSILSAGTYSLPPAELAPDEPLPLEAEPDDRLVTDEAEPGDSNTASAQRSAPLSARASDFPPSWHARR